MEVVCDNAPADPALCAAEAMKQAARQPVPSFEDTDASLTSRAPSEAAAKPPLVLCLSLRRSGPPCGWHADLLDPGGFCRISVRLGPEARIGSDQAGRSTEDALMTLN